MHFYTNIFYILIYFMITLYLYYYKNALQTPTLNAAFTQRLYSVHAARPQRAHGAVKDHTAFPQRAV